MFKNPKYVYGSTDVSLPLRLNFGEFILKKILSYGDRAAFINGETHGVVTYQQIAQEAMNFAISLSKLGVKKGQVVAICSENRFEFLSAVIGVICTGAILTPVNLVYNEDEIKHVMGISKPQYLICSSLSYMLHEEHFRAVKTMKEIIVLGDEPVQGALKYANLANTGPNKALYKDVRYVDFDTVEVEGQTDLAFILYSSGTTGLPKGVPITHLNIISSICCGFVNPIEHPKERVGLSIAPWFHAMGLMGSLTTLCLGNKCVFLPMFDVNQYLDTIDKYKITVMVVVPQVLVALLKAETQHDLGSVEIIMCGAAPLNIETFAAIRNRFKSVKAIIQGYGLTESTLAVSKDGNNGTDEDLAKIKEGSVGPVLAGVVVKVVETETREPLGPNQPGEICVKGPMIMKGYIGKDRNEDFDEEGFFKTGDVGYYDNDGYFFIVDRLKELIKYKGYQVAPAEIEAVLLQHEAVRDAGVVGIENKAAGEVPLAFVVLQPDKKIDPKELQNFVADKLSNYKQLRGGVRFIDELPRNMSGKILRRKLKALVNNGRSKL